MPEESVKQQARHADVQVKNIMHNVHNSSYGKKIPLKIEGLSLKTLLRLGLCAKIGYLFPTYLIVALTAVPDNFLRYPANLFKSIYIFIAVLDLIVEVFISMGQITTLFMAVPVAALVKNISLILITFCYVIGHLTATCFIMWVAFLSTTLAIDFLYVFYVSALFNDVKEASEEGKAENEEKAADQV